MTKQPPKKKRPSNKANETLSALRGMLGQFAHTEQGAEQLANLLRQVGMTDEEISARLDAFRADNPTVASRLPPTTVKKAKAWLEAYGEEATRARLKRGDLPDDDIDALLDELKRGIV